MRRAVPNSPIHRNRTPDLGTLSTLLLNSRADSAPNRRRSRPRREPADEHDCWRRKSRDGLAQIPPPKPGVNRSEDERQSPERRPERAPPDPRRLSDDEKQVSA